MAVRGSGSRPGRRSRGRNGAGGFVIAGAIVVAAWILRTPDPKPATAAAPVVVAEYDTINLPVPVEPVPAGTRVGDIRLRSVPFPRHQVPRGALSSLESVAESVTLTALPANVPLFPENFTTHAALSNPVIERIPPGMRAMTIRVDATAAVEGWAGSGSVVDVLLVERDRTSVVAEKVKILSAERSVSPVEGAAAPNVPSTVTLLVTQEQCLAINTAIPLGKIAFALRSTSDADRWARTSFTADRLQSRNAVPSQQPLEISGYVAVEGGTQRFALTGGKWVATEKVPDGFLVAGER